tara:strand:- start:3248 stop:3625 length:378 start_codon:yes stop_codon:yes gene_type:complete
MSKFIINTEFRGIAGVRAYHAALTLQRSIYYTPICPHTDYVKATEWFDELVDDEKRRILKVAIDDGAELDAEEIHAILLFAKDQNGVPLGKESINGLEAFAIHDALLDVVCEIFKKKVFFYQTNK